MNEESRNYATIEQIFDVLTRRDADTFGQLALAHPTLLTEDEKRQLIAAAHAGDSDALSQVVNAEIVFAASIAKQYVHGGVHVCVLIEHAVRGILDAVEAYNLDEHNEMSFTAFAATKMRENISAGIAEKL